MQGVQDTSAMAWSPRDTTLLAWCIAGSVAAHVLMLTVLPGLQKAAEPPKPLTVELVKPPEVEPPKPLPAEKKPLPEPKAKPEPQKPVPREERLAEAPRQILTAPLDAPASPAAPVVQVTPEQKPVPPPPPPEAPRATPAPSAPVTPPRSDAAHLSNPPPVYPMASQRRGDRGTVLLRLIVTADGLAKNVEVDKSSGHRALDDSAVAAVRSWRFVPARQGGQAIDWPYTQSIVFKPPE